ncbi:hypothetical protein [Chroococcidiopsis thermalis]|uniref:Ribbon-helix-helix protein CopG domain-containing protein n=1 Tax=Chroococcidiopsis thermalis (strain PCC 7203) TaxID=251229 RepID=K9TV17_CHRTP|nr:hypothetical protein [Chroococcidiopsis thermalis]AFY86692.1 hypothetical protein Chro_1164 [Chroococcidiopsis thermalis PCC 7203]
MRRLRLVQKTVGIPTDTLDKAEDYCELHSLALSDVVRAALVEYLNKHYQNKSRDI